ncbi:MAG: hypothetical protein JSR93_01125, partial [Verrucomicrobia bacterium]|nr:hypothetical protein [Verrucomicrobiota bacterium]
MKKPFLSALTIVSMLLTPYLRAQDPTPTITPKLEPGTSTASPTSIPEPQMGGADAPSSAPQRYGSEAVAPAQSPEPDSPEATAPASTPAPNGPEASASNPAPVQEPAEQSTLATEPESEDEGTPVGQASTEGSKTAKKKMWSNIALAVVTVAIAV